MSAPTTKRPPMKKPGSPAGQPSGHERAFLALLEDRLPAVLYRGSLTKACYGWTTRARGRPR
jgi:hypothetical protein